MDIQSRIYSECLGGFSVFYWEVWDADDAATADGTPILYGRGVRESREEAEACAAARVKEAPDRAAARRAVGN